MIGRLGLVAGLLGALVAAGGGTAVAAPCTWTASTLPGGDYWSGVIGTDGGTRLAGSAIISGVTHAMLWGTDATATDLGTPFGLNAAAFDVNRSGDVVGTTAVAGREGDRAWFRHGTRTVLLPEPAGAAETRPAGITDDGLIAGTAYDAAGRPTGLLWRGTRLLATARRVAFTGITADGVVSGNRTAGGVSAPVTWTRSGGVRRLPVVPAGPTVAAGTAGRHVAGYWTEDAYFEHPLVWTNGRLRLLDGYGRAAAVNAGGRVVGTFFDISDEQALVWKSVAAAPIILPGSHGRATVVTDAGVVAGINYDGTGERATLWTCT